MGHRLLSFRGAAIRNWGGRYEKARKIVEDNILLTWWLGGYAQRQYANVNAKLEGSSCKVVFGAPQNRKYVERGARAAERFTRTATALPQLLQARFDIRSDTASAAAPTGPDI